MLLPAQPQQCIGPQPGVVVTARRVVVVYAEPDARGREAIYSVATDRALRTVGKRNRITPAGDNADRFDPAAALDRTTGDIWACYYDTSGDSARKHPWFTCTLSRDGGRRWTAPVHASSQASNETADGSNRFGYGETEGLAAVAGVAHPIWTDTRATLVNDEDIYTAAIRAARLPRGK